jgi:transcriptional regulator with XRE-family HTH domain
MPSNPIVPRRRLGLELRKLRELAGVSVDEAAATLECSQSKISRLETGRAVPRSRDVRDLLVRYDNASDSKLEELLLLARDGRDTGAWWNSFRDVIQGEGFPDHLLRFLALEHGATTIQAYSPLLIPGLLQSEGYARAILEVFTPGVSERERERLVQFRMRRQQVLTRSPAPLTLRVTICESVLLRGGPSPAIMKMQLAHMLDVAQDSNRDVTVRIILLSAGIHRGLAGAFSILGFADYADPDLVYLEGPEGAVYLENEEDVYRHRARFDEISDRALDEDTSCRYLDELINRPLRGH